MPRKDGTGPDGKGPKTGRGLGDCNTPSSKKNSLLGQGRGRGGQGRGGQGRGRGGQGRGLK